MTETTDIEPQLEAHRRELLAFCYRMLGSVHDAEDAVQETMLRAWRAADRYDPTRASVRTWLYRIATNVCLTAASRRGAGGRCRPTSRAASDDPAPTARAGDRGRLAAAAARRARRRRRPGGDGDRPRRPAPRPRRRDAAPAGPPAGGRDPARGAGCSASEIAELLDTTTPAVNSALQRARATLAGPAGPPAPGCAPTTPAAAASSTPTSRRSSAPTRRPSRRWSPPT